ncbi:MFS transporter [Enterobacterales bacterium endosymbiont of Anomoneura mori]|uniref:MFS transporter n=1 Tax=Enterobacterales bacterium endosymbiont of Anomoneura mori TaxID=3132096 RepID=UPI00399C863E
MIKNKTFNTFKHKKNILIKPIFYILGAIALSHFFNDLIQSLLLSIYPILQRNFRLSFSQIGFITFTYQLTASLLQPVIGFFIDKYPQPFSLLIGMTFMLSGIILLSIANSFIFILIAAALVGTGSSIFHPESARVASMASGGKHGLAQSLLQVGGNLGSAFGPLLAAVIIVPYGTKNVLWFSLIALLSMFILYKVGSWYKNKHYKSIKEYIAKNKFKYSIKQIFIPIVILILLLFSKYFYLSSISSYYTFYLIHKFGISVQNAQMHLFMFLFSITLGSIIGGPLGDKFGRRYIILFSIFGATPFTLLLPYISLTWISIFTIFIGFIMASAFSSILIYSQELIPGKFGTISGILFGCAFAISGLGAALLGHIADSTSVNFIYKICSYLPFLGFLTLFLPGEVPLKVNKN